MGKDSAARIELGRSFHQMGTVNEKVCESDFVPLLGWYSNAPVFLWLSGRALHQQRKMLWVQFPGNTHTNEKCIT